MTRGKAARWGSVGLLQVPRNSPAGEPQSPRRTQTRKMSVNVQPTPHPQRTPSHALLDDTRHLCHHPGLSLRELLSPLTLEPPV